TSMPRSTSSIATRPVPQPASSTVDGSNPQMKSASPWIERPAAARRAHRSSYSAPRCTPATDDQRDGGSGPVTTRHSQVLGDDLRDLFRCRGGREAAHDVALAVDEELLEVPRDVGGVAVAGLRVLQQAIQIARPVAVHLDL